MGRDFGAHAVSDVSGVGLSVAVVCSRFNLQVTEQLLDGAVDELLQRGVSKDAITVIHVSGAFEIAQAMRAVARQKTRPDAMVALGCLIRGATSHYDHLAHHVTGALDEINATTGIPVGNGVLTCDTLSQALDRVGGEVGHRGRDAVAAALDLARSISDLDAESESSDEATAVR